MNTWTVSPLGMAWQLAAAASSGNLRVTRPHRASLRRPPPLPCPAAVVVDKLVGVRLDGRGANSVTYPTMLTIGSNSKLFGAQYEPSSMKRLLRILYQSFQK